MPSMDDPAIFDEPPAPIIETPEIARRRSRSRTVFLFIACFLIGVIGAATLAYKLGYVGPKSTDPHSLEGYRHRAKAAFRASHWDSPPGDNVRDITNEGLAKYPHDDRLIEIRAEATDEIVKDAIGEKYQGHMDNAAHLAKLAHELDPTDATADRLATEYAQATSENEFDAGVAEDAQSQAPKHAPTSATTHGSVVAPPVTGARGTIDVAPARPSVLVPVAITIRLEVGSGPPKQLPDAATLTVSGPDVAPGTLIPILAESPSIVRGALTFNEPGKFELIFTAKVDGYALKIVRTVVIPAPGGGGQTIDAGKWL